jgi:hypothetical protein
MTFQVTHATDSDTNAERDFILGELKRSGVIGEVRWHQEGERLNLGRVNHYVAGRPAMQRQVNVPSPMVPATPFSEGIEPMTDDEQQLAQAIARAFETLSERLSKELEDAFNQMAQLMGRAQKQQYEIVAHFGK